MNNRNGNGNSSNGMAGYIVSIIFMVYWTYLALSGGAPFIAILFGGFGLYTTIRSAYHQYKRIQANKNNPYNQHGQLNRYENYGPADNNVDPWDVSYPETSEHSYGNPVYNGGERNFCPYCGTPARADFEFCKNCGRQLPD